MRGGPAARGGVSASGPRPSRPRARAVLPRAPSRSLRGAPGLRRAPLRFGPLACRVHRAELPGAAAAAGTAGRRDAPPGRRDSRKGPRALAEPQRRDHRPDAGPRPETSSDLAGDATCPSVRGCRAPPSRDPPFPPCRTESGEALTSRALQGVKEPRGGARRLESAPMPRFPEEGAERPPAAGAGAERGGRRSWSPRSGAGRPGPSQRDPARCPHSRLVFGTHPHVCKSERRLSGAQYGTHEVRAAGPLLPRVPRPHAG